MCCRWLTLPSRMTSAITGELWAACGSTIHRWADYWTLIWGADGPLPLRLWPQIFGVRKWQIKSAIFGQRRWLSVNKRTICQPLCVCNVSENSLLEPLGTQREFEALTGAQVAERSDMHHIHDLRSVACPQSLWDSQASVEQFERDLRTVWGLHHRPSGIHWC